MNRRSFLARITGAFVAVSVACNLKKPEVEYFELDEKPITIVADDWTRITRRSVFYKYPLNTTPLTGLLSLLPDDQHSPDSWFN